MKHVGAIGARRHYQLLDAGMGGAVVDFACLEPLNDPAKISTQRGAFALDEAD